jgi:heme ABC exporter ATP-binding subunit CcmA
MTVIQTENLSRRFGRRWAYSRIALQVAAGEKLLLFGTNGSGKTTLLRTLSTLLPPTVGQLSLFGQPVRRNAGGLRHRIGYVSHSAGLYEDLSAVENLQVYGRLFGRPQTSGEAAARLSEVGLGARSEPVRTFSEGMRKRTALAILQLKQPELVLLDEPFSALDPNGVDELSAVIRSMDAAVVIASHQVERAAALCDRAVLLEGGQARWKGAASRAWSAWAAAQQEGA